MIILALHATCLVHFYIPPSPHVKEKSAKDTFIHFILIIIKTEETKELCLETFSFFY